MKYIAWIPGLKMIAIGNSTALGHATNESDIDLFIVTAPKSLWLVRILVTGIFAILGVRKTDKNHAGKMCLSFFVTLEGMNLSNFALPSDIYLYFWCIYLRPLVNYDDIYQDFLHSQTWADFSEYAEEIRTRTSEYIVYSEGGRKENIFSRWLDHLFKVLFLPRTLRSFEKLGKPEGVKIGEHILKFHDEDRRQEISKSFQKIL